MAITTSDGFNNLISEEVMRNTQICAAIDAQLTFLALNNLACEYVRIKPDDLIGKSVIQLFPDIIASKNHRNMLRALSGKAITDDLIESRRGDILKTSYEPVFVDNEVKAVIIRAELYKSEGRNEA